MEFEKFIFRGIMAIGVALDIALSKDYEDFEFLITFMLPKLKGNKGILVLEVALYSIFIGCIGFLLLEPSTDRQAFICGLSSRKVISGYFKNRGFISESKGGKVANEQPSVAR